MVLSPSIHNFILLFSILRSTRLIFAQTLQYRILISPEVAAREETIRFMTYAYEKFETKCVTIISDDYLSHMVGSLTTCSLFQVGLCSAYNYEIHYKGGNISTMVSKTLETGYKRRCGGYVILLQQTNTILQLLHLGYIFQILNTRAKFLIWYGANDKKFEKDEIWGKIPNIIAFSLIRLTMSILIMISIILEQYILKDGLLFTVRELKWPINITPTEGRVRVIEFWGHNHTDSEKKQIWFYDKTIDLKNLTLKIVVVDHPPGVVKYTDSNGMVEYAGTEIEIVKSLSKIMKFSYEFYDADPVTKWGGRNVSSSNSREFYGAIAQLIYGEADMAIGSFFILKHYLSYIDMSIPLEVACTSFLTPNPLPRPRYLALLLPFRFELWILLMILSILIGPFFLYIYTRPNYYKTEHGVFKNQILLTSCRIMTQVALHFWPKFWPIRIYIAFYWFFWFCITSGYRGAMVSFLTIPLYGRVIDNTKELVESNFGIGGCGEELQRIFLQHLEVNPDLYIRTTLSQRYEVLTDLNEGIGRVAAGNFALYENTRFLKYTRMTRNLSKSGYPQMRLMKQCIVPVQIGFAYQKLSPITWTINRYIRSFQESGLTNRWAQGLIVLTKERNRENPDNNENSISDGGIDDSIPDTNKSRKQRVLRIQDLQGAVYLLVLGLTLSFLTFIGEFFFQKCRQTSKDVILKKLINTSIISTYVIGDFKKEKLVDVRVRKKKKVKVPKKLPLYPYLE